MTHDHRYAPPDAELVDVDPPGAPAQRPVQVQWAVRLLWAGFAIELANGVSFVARSASEWGMATWIAFTVIAGVFLVLYALLIVQIGQGRNWARILLLLLMVAGAFGMLTPTEEEESVTLFETLSGAASTGLDFVALVLVFVPPGRAWFRRRA